MCARDVQTVRYGQLFVRNDSKSAWDVQNSKTRSIFSFETSQNVHEKCLLTGPPNTTRRGQLFHLKVDWTVSWQNISNRATWWFADVLLTLSIERRKVEIAASQNSKIRSTFSFEISKNEHEKCLLCRAFKNSNMQSTFCSFRHFTICFTLSDGKLTLPPILLSILLCLTCTFWWILKAKVDQMQSRSAHFDAKSWPHLAGLIGFLRILRIRPLNFVILGIRPLNSANLRIRPLN